MSEADNAILAVWNDVDPAHEAEFNEWYQRQHLLERLGVPGFLSARRYVSLRGGLKYAAFYDIENIGVMTSAEYLQRQENPTQWTGRVMPWFRSMTRSVCRVAACAGRGIGAVAGCISFPASTDESALTRVAGDIFSRIVADPAILKAQLWIADQGTSKVNTAEAAMRLGQDRVAERVIVIDGIDQASVERACETAVQELRAQSLAAGEPSIYRLLCRLP